MSRASRLAHWWLYHNRLPAITRAVGDMPTSNPVTVEILIDGVWTDITSYVMVRDGSNQIEISVGQQGEGASVQPSTCSFQLNNRDGRFSPRNPMSPLYGKIGRNTQMRVSVPQGNEKNYRFWGEIPAWPQHWDTTGTDVWVEVEAAGILRRLSQGTSPLRSVMYRALTSSAQTNPPVAYWPCEDATAATTLASGLSEGVPMAIVGTPTLSSSTVFDCSAALPVMASGSLNGTVPSFTTTGEWQVRFLLSIPATGAVNGQRVCIIKTKGTSMDTWTVTYGTGGTLTLNASGPDGDGGTLGPYAFGLDGKLVMVSIAADSGSVSPSGTTFTTSTLVVGQSTATTFTETLFSFNLDDIKQVSMAPDGGLTDTVMGHVHVQDTIDDLDDMSEALAAYAGETAGERIQRLEGEEGIDFGWFGDLEDTVAMGSQSQSSLLDLITECVTADVGILYERWSAFGLGYRPRTDMENQSAGLELDYSAFNLSEVPIPQDDDQLTKNDVTVTRTNGSSARAQQTDGPLSIYSPPTGVGVYDDSVTVNVQLDSQLPDQAGWRLHLGTVDEARYPQISVNLTHPSFTLQPWLKSDAMELHNGDRIVITNPPSWLPPDDISLIVLGRTEQIDQFQHTMTFNCAPESPYHVSVVEDDFYGWADTEGSALSADLSTTGTTMSVTTTSGPRWTTDTTDMPFDLRVGGEVVTVTGMANGTSDSFTRSLSATFSDTFTRSVSSSWGTSDSGQGYTLNGGASADYNVNGSQGTISVTAVNSSRFTTPAFITLTDLDMQADVSVPVTATGASISTGLRLRSSDTSNFYYIEMIWATSGNIQIQLVSRVAAVSTTIGGPVTAGAYAPGDTWRVRARLVGSVLQAKLWKVGTTEPTDWQVQAITTTLTGAQPIGTRTLLSTGNTNTLPVVVSWDNIVAYNVSQGWGTATGGGGWSESGTDAEYNVTDGYGAIALTTVDSSRKATIGNNYADVDMAVTVRPPVVAATDSIDLGLVGRYADSSNYYLGTLHFHNDSTVDARIRKLVAGVYTTIAISGTVSTYAAGDRFRVRFAISGSDLLLKAWPASSDEPQSWLTTVSDTDITAAGQVGCRANLQVNNTNTLPMDVRFDDFVSAQFEVFTVTRSVNGVVKAHTTGEDVRLAYPPIVGM